MRAIYEPRGRAREYAALAVNLYTGGWNGGGCNNGCRYCYVQWMLGFRDRRGQPVRLRDGVLEQLEKDADELGARGCQEEILLSFTHDPATKAVPQTIWLGIKMEAIRAALHILAARDVRWTVLTKRPMHLLRYCEAEFIMARHKARFGVSLSWSPRTTAARYLSAWWEPGAETPLCRMAALKRAKELGLRTWVSLEPVLDPWHAIELVCRYSHLVDEWRIGLANHVSRWPLEAKRRYNWYWMGYYARRHPDWTWDAGGSWSVAFRDFGEELAEALQHHAPAWYIKRSLQPYIPEGFPAVKLPAEAGSGNARVAQAQGK